MNLLKKGTKLYSIINFKCPRCQEGDLFLVKNPYKLRTLDKMPNYCSVCGEDLQREVGFYYGSMMISHGTTTILAVLDHLVIYQFYGWETLPNVLSIVIVMFGFFPIIFRSSRVIWLNIFVKYDVNAIKNKMIRDK
jgi:uncharacterized protein (DUF983 family)